MADKDDIKEGKNFGLDTPQENKPFHVKGAGALDWGMQNRLARIFNRDSGRTVMLAFDHGYFQGPTTGLERIDLSIVPLIPYADVLMCTRGALRSVIPASATNPVVLRCSGGNSILSELSNEAVAVDIEDAIRVNAAAITTQIYIGAPYEHQSIKNLIQLIDTGNRYGIPTMAVTGVGADMVRDQRYFSLATRIAAELGSHYVKSWTPRKTLTFGGVTPELASGGLPCRPFGPVFRFLMSVSGVSERVFLYPGALRALSQTRRFIL